MSAQRDVNQMGPQEVEESWVLSLHQFVTHPKHLYHNKLRDIKHTGRRMHQHESLIIEYWQLKLESSQSEKICDVSKSREINQIILTLQKVDLEQEQYKYC